MSTKPTRREWLKLSALSGAALAFASLDFSAPAGAQTVAGKFIKLSSNENPDGFSPRAREALLGAIGDGNRYADPDAVAKLEQEIAAREGVRPESVVLGSGSGEVLCMAAVAFGQKEIVAPDPTFPSLMRYAELFGARIRSVPLDAKFEHDFAAMSKEINQHTSLAYVCHPNNPTAGLSPLEAVRAFCREAARKTVVFADEAYLEYTDEYPRNSMVELVKAGENVVVSRTFSKIYGLAGLRLGYGLAKPELAQKLKRYRMTWFNNLTVTAARAAYADQDFVAESRRRNAEVRRRLTAEMDKMNLRYAPSDANFIWLNVGPALNDLGDRMRAHRILLGNPRGGWARVTVGTAEETQAFVNALKEIKK